MFTIEQIRAAHAKVKSGADFPAYIKDLRQLGVKGYVTFVSDGHTMYAGKDGYKAVSPPKYEALHIAAVSDTAQFKALLKAHQQGNTDYPTFCNDCASTGIEKWEVSLDENTCSYYDRAGNKVLVEEIPG